MSGPSLIIAEALSSLREMLAADGYELELNEDGPALVAEIKVGPEACADCLVPKDMMRLYFEQALKPVCGPEAPEVRLVYPEDGSG